MLKPISLPLIQPCMFVMLFSPCRVQHVLMLVYLLHLHNPDCCSDLEDIWGFSMMISTSSRVCHQSAACGLYFWRSATSCSHWCYDYDTFGHVILLNTSFMFWHCVLVFTKSMYVWTLILANMYSMHSSLPSNSGVTYRICVMTDDELHEWVE
jgi:hypothetical protein